MTGALLESSTLFFAIESSLWLSADCSRMNRILSVSNLANLLAKNTDWTKTRSKSPLRHALYVDEMVEEKLISPFSLARY